MNALEKQIDQALGNEPADLVIKNVRLLDLNTGRLTRTDIAVCGGVIAGTYGSYKGKKEINGKDQIAVPGFIDAHVHVESSMLTPYEFERCVLPMGTTCAVCDPHELANVCGARALAYFLDCARGMCMDLYVNFSSCVPATRLETSGAAVRAADLKPLKDAPQSLGLAELMNVPGVLYKDKETLAKAALFAGKQIDGHAPLLGGKALNAYLTCGVSNDHECSSLKEAQEKLAKGMKIFIREGGVAKNLAALSPLVRDAFIPSVAFCTDDRTPADVKREGHINFLIAKAIALGAAPHTAYKTATFSAAQALGLKKTGLIAPGYKADIVLVGDLKKCAVSRVFKNGREVTPRLFAARPPEPDVSFALNTFKCAPVRAADLQVRARGPKTPVIGMIPRSLITRYLVKNLRVENGLKLPDAKRDILKTAVVGRHHLKNHIGLGFVQGFGLKAGALASSVAHDSHNISVAGTNDADMAAAVNAVIRMNGGQVAVKDGKVLARLPLPVGGLMSRKTHTSVSREIETLRRAAQKLGCALEDPFLQLAFLQLPVIPHLKLTDLGLVDADRFELVRQDGQEEKRPKRK